MSLHGSSLSPPAHHVPVPLHLSASSCGMVLRVGSPSLVRTFAGLSPPAILLCSCALRLASPALMSSADFCPVTTHVAMRGAPSSRWAQSRTDLPASHGFRLAGYVRCAPIPKVRTKTSATQAFHLPPGLNDGISLCCASLSHPVGLEWTSCTSPGGFLPAFLPKVGRPSAVGFG